MTSPSFFDVVLFVYSSIVTGPSFMLIPSLVLELWQISIIRDWPEIRKSEIPPSEFCPTSGDWCELGIPNLARMSLMKCYWILKNARMSLMKCYWILKNARVTAFTVSELNYLNRKLHFFVKWVLWVLLVERTTKSGK